MKKMLLSGIAGWMAFSMLLPVQAAEVQPYCGIGCCDVAQCFTDADNDGICGDHCFLDEDGDGICDNCLGNGANCPGYADADGNGVCDSYEGAAAGRGHHGRGHGCMR